MKSRPILEFIKGENSVDFKDARSIEVIGNKRIIIESVTKITEYENERVCVLCAKLAIAVNGTGLTIDSYNENIIVVNGSIESISFERC